METDAICEVCGRTDHFSAEGPMALVAAVAAAGWDVTPEHRYCPDHAVVETA